MIKARPTEYRGVRFRSKSEAIFARYLGLSAQEDESIRRFQFNHEGLNVFCCPYTHLEYEPHAGISGWSPDFLVATCHYFDDNSNRVDYCHSEWLYTYIEYKPVRPTETYIKSWQNLTRGIHAKLYYGSPFTESPRGFLWQRTRDDASVCLTEDSDDWVGYFPDLMDYRFDLPNGGS